MPPKRPASHAERAAELLKRARSAPRDKVDRVDDAQTIPLPRLLHALHTMAQVPVAEAMVITRTLIAKKRHTRAQLCRISAPELEHIGVPCTGATRDRVVQVLQGLARADETGGLTEAERASQQQRLREDVQLRREWGNTSKDTVSTKDESDDVFDFHAVLDETALRGRHVLVNRAPVMTAWAVVVLQFLGFRVQEALSLAHCYVSTTAEARAQTLGQAKATAPAHVTSANQPHVDFLQVRIPVIQLRQGQYRGLHAGEVIPPTRAFDYLRRSMFQMLPHVMGALTLLAQAYMGPKNDTEALQRHAYGLYVDFRPDTQGAWGKRAILSLDTILDLRQNAAQASHTASSDVSTHTNATKHS